MLERFGKDFGEPVLVVFRYMQPRLRGQDRSCTSCVVHALHTEFEHGSASVARCDFQYVEVSRWPRKSVHHGDDEPSDTILPDFLTYRRIQFAQE